MFNTNPFYGIFHNLLLGISGRICYVREDIGKNIVMDDGKVYTVFRRVIIQPPKGGEKPPEGLFIVRFKPEGMTIEENIRYSKRAMLVFQGFKGFRTKYWTVDYHTGDCQGIYEWAAYEDAERYSKSIAVKVMTNRSVKGSVSFKVLRNTPENRTFKIEPGVSQC